MAAGFRWTGGDLPGPPLSPNGQFSLFGVAKRSASSAGAVFDDPLQFYVMLLQARDRELTCNLTRDLTHDRNLAHDLSGMTLGSILQEGFRPDLSRSWPSLGLQGLRG